MNRTEADALDRYLTDPGWGTYTNPDSEFENDKDEEDSEEDED